MRFIHTADNHLDVPLSSLPPQKAALRRAQRLSSFSKIIDYTKLNADMLLISGDLFHSPAPSKSVLSFCINEFKKLGDIPVFIALGNHDYGIDASYFPGNVHVFKNHIEKIQYKDAVIYGVSFSSQDAYFENLIPPAEDNKKTNILCLHGDIFNKSSYNPMNKDKLSSLGYDYVALGHVHEHTKYKNIVYPGCHDGSGFDEKGEKVFIDCEISGSKLNILPIPSSSIIYDEINFDISSFSSSYGIANALMDSFPDGIYKFNLTGEANSGFSPNCDAIESYISQKFFFSKTEDKTKIIDFSSEGVLFTLFCEYITKNCDPDISELAIRYAQAALKGGCDLYDN